MCVCVVWVHPHATMEGTTPAQLLEIYEAGLAATPQEPASEPCAPLHALLKQAAENDVPLSALELRGAPIGRAGGAKAFAAVLKADTFVTFANLEEAGLGDEGAALVSDALRRHPTIFRLDLGYNGISGRGVKAVAALVAESPALLCLDMSGNSLYTRLGMLAPSALSALAPMGKALAQPTCKLQLLHLDQSDIEVKGLTSLVDGLVKNESLLNLRLGENSLDAKAATLLAKLLKNNHTLTSLDLRENNLKDEGCAAL